MLAGSPSPGMTANHHLVLSRDRASANSLRPRGLRSPDSAPTTRLLRLPGTAALPSPQEGLCGQWGDNRDHVLRLRVSVHLLLTPLGLTGPAGGVLPPDPSASGSWAGKGAWVLAGGESGPPISSKNPYHFGNSLSPQPGGFLAQEIYNFRQQLSSFIFQRCSKTSPVALIG